MKPDSPPDKELSDLVRVAGEQYFLPSHSNLFRKHPLDLGCYLPETRAVAEAFRYSVDAVISVASLPCTIATASVGREWQARYFIAERIIAENNKSSDSQHNEKQLDELAANESAEKLAESVKKREFADRLGKQTLDFLLELSNKSEFKSTAEDLLRQATVLTWGAFEVLCRDTFVLLLNLDKTKVDALLASPITQRVFQIKGLDFKILSEFNFNVSQCMGTIFSRYNNVASIATIKDVFGALFPHSAELIKALGSTHLWHLSQRRHLIVHKRAVVDVEYLKNTGESLPVGTILSVKPADIEKYLGCVIEAGAQLIHEVDSSLRAPGLKGAGK